MEGGGAADGVTAIHAAPMRVHEGLMLLDCPRAAPDPRHAHVEKQVVAWNFVIGELNCLLSFCDLSIGCRVSVCEVRRVRCVFLTVVRRRVVTRVESVFFVFELF